MKKALVTACSLLFTASALAQQPADLESRIRQGWQDFVKKDHAKVAAMLTDDDPEFTALFRQIFVKQRDHLEAVIDAGRADGSLRADIDSATLIDAVVGAYIAEHARSGGLADGWENRLFELFWPAVQPVGR